MQHSNTDWLAVVHFSLQWRNYVIRKSWVNFNYGIVCSFMHRMTLKREERRVHESVWSLKRICLKFSNFPVFHCTLQWETLLSLRLYFTQRNMSKILHKKVSIASKLEKSSADKEDDDKLLNSHLYGRTKRGAATRTHLPTEIFISCSWKFE